MLSISSQSTSFLQSNANVDQFSKRLEDKRLAENKLQPSKDESSSSNKNVSSNKSEDLLEQRQLQTLKTRDREVKAHELAHASVGGKYASGASYTYEKGSDGVLYAVAGEVSISTSAISGDPRATLEKAQIVQRAALAPASPSPQDRSVATSASALAQKARVEIVQLLEIESYSDTPKNSNTLLDETA